MRPVGGRFVDNADTDFGAMCVSGGRTSFEMKWTKLIHHKPERTLELLDCAAVAVTRPRSEWLATPAAESSIDTGQESAIA